MRFAFHLTAVLIASTIVLLLCDAAIAQQNAQGQLPVTSVAQPYLFLIRDPIVHDDLKLNAAQREAVATMNDELDGPLWSMRNKSAQHIEETRLKATATARTRLAAILTPDQQGRLEQVELWSLGTKAFMHDYLPETLKLSEEQRKGIRKTVTEMLEAVSDLAKQLQSGRPRQSLEEAARKLQTDAQKKILATLTRRQQEEWVALLGKRIDVAKLGRVKFKAPVLHGQEDWINSSPLAAEQLQGKVVALYFYAFG